MAGAIGKAFKAMFGGGKPAARKPSKAAKAKSAKAAKGAKSAKPRTAKAAKGKVKAAARTAPPAPVAADSIDSDMENVELALALARAEAVLDEPKRLPAADSPLKADLTRALEDEAARGGDAGAKAAALLQQIDGGAPAVPAAHTPQPVPDAEMPTDREALIAHALSIHREKSKMISRLPREARERLFIMAQHAFGGAGRGTR